MELWFELNLMENLLIIRLIIIYMSNDPFTEIHTKYSYSIAPRIVLCNVQWKISGHAWYYKN